MDDELEDKVFYQTYVSHMKILSKFAVGFSSINSPLAYVWKLCRLYVLRPEVIFCGIILFFLLIYLQAVDIWSRGILGRIQASLGRQKNPRDRRGLETNCNGDLQCWSDVKPQSSAFAVLGRRPRMEDRFILEENINNNTGISFFAVFDGHGGEFAADFAKDILVKNIYNKVIETIKLVNETQQHYKSLAFGKDKEGEGDLDYGDYDVSPYLKRKVSRKEAGNKENEVSSGLGRKDSFRKSASSADDCVRSRNTNSNIDDVYASKLNSLIRNNGNNAAGKPAFLNNNAYNQANENPPASLHAKCYIDNGRIDFGKLITDEVLAADYKLINAARKATNIAGTTALIAIIHGSRLVVGNVGDSRGVMCDARGNAIPLSFDHKPQQVRERKRIRDAGGFISFRGVWRVAGILATSRALGDYPLKDKNLVIANPDILTFDLNDHKPLFLILASDGLWDTFSNEEACNYVKQHLNENDFGAKSLAMQSYQRGSVDNITVLIIVFRNGTYRIASAQQKSNPTNTNSKQNSNTNSNLNLNSNSNQKQQEQEKQEQKEQNHLNQQQQRSIPGSARHVAESQAEVVQASANADFRQGSLKKRNI